MNRLLYSKTRAVLLYALPIILLISLIPIVSNEYALGLIYAFSIVGLVCIKSEKNDLLAVAFGIVGITISEYFFVRTGVETFTQQSLFGVMPLWLPLLWGYSFLTIKRSLRILDR